MHTMEYPKKVEILKSETPHRWKRFLVGDGDVLVDLLEKKDGAVREIARRWNAHPQLAAFMEQVARMKTTDEAEEDLGNDEAMNGLIRSARAILNELNP